MVAQTAVSIGLLWCSAGASYVNNYDTSDNAYGVKLPSGDVHDSSFAFLVSDYGLPTTSTGSCCQTMVADAMRAKKAALEGEGKQLLFVGASGDSFYWTGLGDGASSGDDQWTRWNNVYGDELTSVPWFAVMVRRLIVEP